jgi:hypothetical protein
LFAVFAAIGVVSLFWRYTTPPGLHPAMTAFPYAIAWRMRKRYGCLDEP